MEIMIGIVVFFSTLLILVVSTKSTPEIDLPVSKKSNTDQMEYILEPETEIINLGKKVVAVTTLSGDIYTVTTKGFYSEGIVNTDIFFYGFHRFNTYTKCDELFRELIHGNAIIKTDCGNFIPRHQVKRMTVVKDESIEYEFTFTRKVNNSPYMRDSLKVEAKKLEE